MRAVVFAIAMICGLVALGVGIYFAWPKGAGVVVPIICGGLAYGFLIPLVFRKFWRPSFVYSPSGDRSGEKYVNVVWAGGKGKSEARSADNLVNQVGALFDEGRRVVALVHSFAPSYQLVAVRGGEGEGVCLCYFTGRKSGHPGFISKPLDGRSEEGPVVSKVRTDKGQAMRLGRGNIVDEGQAFDGIKEFFEEPKLPSSLLWVVAN